MNIASSPDSALEKLSQKELDDIIKKHMTFLKGIRGGARAVLKFKDLSGLTFRRGDLSQADFTGSVMIGANLSRGKFCGVSFFACDMRDSDLSDGDFSRADFRGAYVAGANLSGADMKSADLREGRVMERSSTGTLESKSWGDTRDSVQRTIFTGAKMKETNLSGSRASTADFSDADLSGVIIKDADFSGANFDGANLSNADFTGSNLTNAKLNSTIMTGTILMMTETAGANLSDALNDRNMGHKLEDMKKTLDQLIKDHTAWVATAGKQGKRLDLSGYDLRDVPYLAVHPMTAVKAVGANFLQQNLTGIEMQSAQLDRADFRDSVLKESDLRGSSFKNAMFARADLTGSNMSPLKFNNPDGSHWLQRVNLSGANMRYAVLQGVNLSDAILVGVDFSHAILMDCDLRRADLREAILDGADISGALLSNAIVDDKYKDKIK